MKFLLIGAPASGKGTVGEKLSEKLGIPVLTVGGIFRNVPPDSPHYKEIHDPMDKGLLVPAELAANLLRDELAKEMYLGGFILDGWMRDLDQERHFDPGIDFAIYPRVSDETALERSRDREDKRGDDNEEVMKRRLEHFHSDTMPVVEKFRKEGKLIEVDGEPNREEVFEEVWSRLKPHLK